MEYNHRIRLIITDSIRGDLGEICLKFIQNKFPLTFRSTNQYISKSCMHLDKTWGGDIELFSISLLLKTDIWVNTTELRNKWMVYSGKGAGLSRYIKHTGNHYEPISELTVINSDN